VIQYTARDVRSGLLFWSLAQHRSSTLSTVFAARIQQHLDRYGVSLRDLGWQTDNGGEFAFLSISMGCALLNVCVFEQKGEPQRSKLISSPGI
jgi:hypothetical protein